MNERNFSRTTITVPKELKKRMKLAGSSVNWSAVACDSFETKLAEIGPIEVVTTIDAMVERLKKQKLEAPEEPSGGAPSGIESGRHWAMNHATVEQLASLEQFRAEVSAGEWSDILRTREGWFEITRRLAPSPDSSETEESCGPRHDPGRHGPGRHGPGRHAPGQGPRHRRHRRCKSGRHRHGRAGHHRAKEFWREVLEERPREDDFLLGFANGALEVWDQVKAKI